MNDVTDELLQKILDALETDLKEIIAVQKQILAALTAGQKP